MERTTRKGCGMSWVANVMLSIDLVDRDNAADFAGWIERACPLRDQVGAGGVGTLALITGDETQWAGNKRPECNIFAGALNRASIAAILDQFASMPWRHPNAVQLFIMDQEDSYFRLWMLRDGKLMQYAPTAPGEDDDEFRPDAYL